MLKTKSFMFSMIIMSICGLCLGKVVKIIKETYSYIKISRKGVDDENSN